MEHKIIVIGEYAVGKTSMINWLIYDNCNTPVYPTIGASYFRKKITVGESEIVLDVWDTAGQDRFRSMVKTYYRRTCGCILVFDVTNRNSFEKIADWYTDYKNNNTVENSVTVIAANKCDLDLSLWKVTLAEIEEFRKIYDCEVFYTNCINGENINKLFGRLAELVYDIKVCKTYDQIIEKPINIYDQIDKGQNINSTGFLSSIIKYC